MTSSDHEKLKVQMEEISRESKDAVAELLLSFDVVLDSCDTFRSVLPDDAAAQEALTKIYEIGSVQDVIRQRIEKIGRIAARVIDPSLPEDDALLSGPQSGVNSTQQEDVNRLLEDFD